MPVRLYNFELSGNCYKLRLMMNILGVPFERVTINFFPTKEHKSPEFLRINPLGQLPVIEDGNFRLRDAQAILVYLASKYDASKLWYPEDAAKRGETNLWLGVAEDITRSASAARLHDSFGYDFDIVRCRQDALRIFAMLDEHLADGEMDDAGWLISNHPTIADIACFPYVALATEGGISLTDFPALRRWVSRVKTIPGFIGMPGIFARELDGPN